MKNSLSMLLLAAAMVAGAGCNANKSGHEDAGSEAAPEEVLAEPSATDQAETISTTPDSVRAVLADSARQQGQ